MPTTSQHRHVSLANIATAFLTERKSSSRRHSTRRRKKRLTIQEKRTSNSRHSNDTSHGQRISLDANEGGMAVFMTTLNGNNANNKHRTTLVRMTCRKID